VRSRKDRPEGPQTASKVLLQDLVVNSILVAGVFKTLGLRDLCRRYWGPDRPRGFACEARFQLSLDLTGPRSPVSRVAEGH
jgi:hypothetical protein